jgi:hypothetical protein
MDSRRRDRRQVNDSLLARQALDRLAVVGQVGQQKRRRRFAGRDHVDRKHVVLVFEQSADDCPAGLSAGAGDHYLRHEGKLKSSPALLSQLATVFGSDPRTCRMGQKGCKRHL